MYVFEGCSTILYFMYSYTNPRNPYEIKPNESTNPTGFWLSKINSGRHTYKKIDARGENFGSPFHTLLICFVRMLIFYQSSCNFVELSVKSICNKAVFLEKKLTQNSRILKYNFCLVIIFVKMKDIL